MKMLEENRPPCEPAQSKTLRSRTRGFVNHYKTLRLRSNSTVTSGQTYTPARRNCKGEVLEGLNPTAA